jgi:DNA-binding response OmpR family regulator
MDNRGKILIIEDEPGFRTIYKDFLESEGYEVVEAADGEKGLMLIKAEQPDLVLLDIVVPNLNGFEILKKVREEMETKDIPIIIFSVLGDKETIKKGLELGANDFAVKGFYSPGEMLSKIRALLTKSDIRKHIATYQLEFHEGRADAAKLQHDMGFTKLFACPHCDQQAMRFEMTPDYARMDGHWFVGHFVCPQCKRTF